MGLCKRLGVATIAACVAILVGAAGARAETEGLPEEPPSLAEDTPPFLESPSVDGPASVADDARSPADNAPLVADGTPCVAESAPVADDPESIIDGPLALTEPATSPTEDSPPVMSELAPEPVLDDEPAAELDQDYDPWQAFNEPMFTFNYELDRFVVKPAATAWDTVLPDPVQRSIGRAFDNLETPRRLVNNLLQARPGAAGGELARFIINTTVGVAGFFDVAELIHLEKNEADMGQTLGLYGVGPGPYLCLPFLPPLTLRDGIGRGIDGVLDPFDYLIPVPFVVGTAITVVHRVNERSLNLKLFDGVEETVLDLYSAVRNGYLQRRRRAVEYRLVNDADLELRFTRTEAAPPPPADTTENPT